MCAIHGRMETRRVFRSMGEAGWVGARWVAQI